MADVRLSSDAFAHLVGSAGDRVLLFEVAQDFVEEEWAGPVWYRFGRTEGGLLSLEFGSGPAFSCVVDESAGLAEEVGRG